MKGDHKKLTFDQRMLCQALENGRHENENAREEGQPWTECEVETYRTALSLKRRGLIEIHPERNALGDYKARLAVVEKPASADALDAVLSKRNAPGARKNR